VVLAGQRELRVEDRPADPVRPRVLDVRVAARPAHDGAEGEPARGQQLAEAQGCLQCHTTDGSLTATGPTWKGLAGSVRPLTDGSEVVADDTYLFNSIVDPRSQIVEGYEAVMPVFFADQLDEQQIDDLVEYIKSLAS